MSLYKATYDWVEDNCRTREVSLYILAPDFQAAARLAETNEKISGPLRAIGDLSKGLSRVELIAFDVVQD
jgi:hypothetical protein